MAVACGVKIKDSAETEILMAIIPHKVIIRLTEPQPNWAQAGVAAINNLRGVEVLVATSQLTPDVILHYGDNPVEACQQYGYGRLGFWFFRFAGRDIDVLKAARHSAAKNLPLEVSLWVRFVDGRCQCLYQSFGFHEPFVVKRGVATNLAKAAYFPVRVLTTYCKTTLLPAITPEIMMIESSACHARFAEAKAIAQKIVRKIIYKEQWFVVAGLSKDECLDMHAQWVLDPGSGCFWADPFPVEHDGRCWVMVEELPYASGRGHLAAIELFNDGTYSASQPVMSGDQHLSYPFVFSWHNALYMLPESSAARNVVLWKCLQFPDRWEQAAVLLTDLRAVDATLIEYQDMWWMFVAMAHEGACVHDELHVYFADSPLGPWQAHPENPVKSDARNARPAGNLYIENGILYRPAQDCATEYGKATVLNRVDCLDKQHFSETPIARLDSQWRKDFLRTHTLSRSENIWAVDGLRLIPRWRLPS
ncbi:hypothetical protein [Crenothrix polyspora]|uniref:Glucosamine inositolphosphorylceramide transferase 1 N-terminal domain-containing protein n=1 Tax=Crenothrix polyspora TaxID=360316 RepID=A0A1R4HF89_9GAMM|nr:hypothetical protein [Crenothrix polyspora]SJM94560.1 hypothetical protein CRENPOLYSF1_550033 [Crenothrix polyspora]